MKRQQRTVGAILAVPLGDEMNCFAITLPDANFAFFDSRTDLFVSPGEVLSKPVLFRIAVHKAAWSTGRWPRVAKVAVPDALLVPVPMFIQDRLNPEQFQIYLDGSMRPATRAECGGLERAAVWDPEHVEDRLRDHYAGRPNVWVESLRLK